MKTMRSFLFPAIIIFVNCLVVNSQQIISNTGVSLQTSSVSIAFTIGEPVIETFSATGGTITQGFHQTRLIVTAIRGTFSNISVKSGLSYITSAEIYYQTVKQKGSCQRLIFGLICPALTFLKCTKTTRLLVPIKS